MFQFVLVILIFMKRGVYNLYRPKKTINDVRETSSYYQAADVHVSPFTRIGHLVDADETAAPAAVPTPHPRVRLKHPVFPAGFMLNRPTTADSGSRRGAAGLLGAATASLAKLSQPLRRAPAAIAGNVAASVAVMRESWHTNLLHHRYVAGKGWVADPLGLSRLARYALPGVIALILVALLVLPSSPPSRLRPRQPGSQGGTTSSTNGGNAALHTQTSAKSGQTGTAQPKSSGAGTGSTAASGGSTTTLSGSGSYAYPLGSSSSPTSTSGTTSQLTGTGKGSGPATTSTSSGSSSTSGGSGGLSIPGVTSPTTVTVPGVNLGAGGKTIVQTSPISITGN